MSVTETATPEAKIIIPDEAAPEHVRGEKNSHDKAASDKLFEARSKVLKPRFDAIPGELKELNQWAVWRYELNSDGKLTKVPYRPLQPTRRASHSDPATWASFDDAVRACQEGDFDGIKFALTREDPYVFVDLDHALYPEYTAFGKETVDYLQSYTERSPSDTGIHIISVGKLDDDLGHKRGDIEMYDHLRFATFTGHTFPNRTEINHKETWRVGDLQADLFEGNTTYFNPDFAYERSYEPMSGAETELLEHFFTLTGGEKWRDVWAGTWFPYYTSQSEADQGLANKLAWLFRYDMTTVDRVFRHSGLMREKWDKRHHSNGDTYGARTLRNALGGHKPGEGYGARKKEPNFVLTETGNAERLVHKYGGEFRYVIGLGFLIYDGQKWVPDHAGMTRLAIDAVRSLHTDIAELNEKLASASLTEEERKTYTAQITNMHKHIRKSESNTSLKATVELTKALAGVVLEANEFDRDPMLLNVQNGTLDLRTGVLREHSADDYLTQITNVNYNADALCPRWDKFQAEIARVEEHDDPEMIEFKQRLWGYTLTGDVSERKLMIAYGFGSNGKSTEIEAMKYVMGSYAKTTPFTTFTAKDRGSMTNDLAALRGARFVSASEGDVGARLSEGVVKNITGNENISARFLHKEYFEFKPLCKILLATNHKPNVVGQDDGIWDRLIPLHYAARFTGERKQSNLGERLRAEAEGILAWAVRGCLEWQKKGLAPTRRVMIDHGAYKSQMDQVGDFLEDKFIEDPKAKVDRKTFQEHFNDWNRLYNVPISTKAMTQCMLERGFKEKKSGSTRYWQGLKERSRLA